MQFRLVTLGSAELRIQGSPTPVLRAGKPLALLIYLSALPGQSASREHLVELLWSDTEPQRALGTLRQTLFQLRQVLGAEALESSGRQVRLSLIPGSDHTELLDAIAGGDAVAALEVRKGSFLSDLAFPGAAEFEAWASMERTRLDTGYLRLASSYARSLLGRGAAPAALAIARRLHNELPAEEPLWRLVVELELANGNRTVAASELAALRAALAADDRQPDAATLALERRLASPGDSGDTVNSGERISMVGRAAELATLIGLEESSRGSARLAVAHVTAGAGGGKTRLVEELHARLRTMGRAVSIVRVRPPDQAVEWSMAAKFAQALAAQPGAMGLGQPSVTILLAIAPALATAFPAVPRAPSLGGVNVAQVAGALAELVDATADERPFTVVLDDLHWGDVASTRAIAAALSRVSACKVCVVTTARSGTRALDPEARVLELEPLSPDEVWAILAEMGELPAAAWAHAVIDALVASSGGNPLDVLQLVRQAREHGALILASERWECPDAAALQTLWREGEVTQARMTQLSSAELQLALALAMAQFPFTTAVLRRWAELNSVGLRADLDSLVALGIAVTAGEAVALAHDRFGEAATALAGPDGGARVHEMLAAIATESYTAGEGNDETLARAAVAHWLACGRLSRAGAVVKAWARRRRADGDRTPRAALASAITPAGESDSVRRALERQVSTVWWRSPAVISGGGVLLTAAAVLVAVGAGAGDHVVVTTAPISVEPQMSPVPAVRVVDWRGRQRGTSGDTIWLSSSTGRFEGDTVAVTEHGSANFPGLVLHDREPALWTFRLGRHDRRPASLRIDPVPASWLRVRSAAINGVRADNGVVRIRAGDSVRVRVELQYSSQWAAAAVVLGATGDWGQPEHAFVRVNSLATPADRAQLSAAFTLPIPVPRGLHHVILAFQAEDNVSFVMSSTNWTVGTPMWTDGNEVALWSAAQLDQARRWGRVTASYTKLDGTYVHGVPAAVIDVIAD